MNVLLINPRTPKIIKNKEYYIPSGLLYIASILGYKGHNVIFADLNTNEMPFFKDIDIIGIGCLFSGQFPEVLEITKILKSYINVPIVIGGIHPTIHAREILENCKNIDYIILGEAEGTVLQLLDAIKNKRDPIGINGIAYRMGKGIVVNKKSFYIEDIDYLPFPAYNLIDIKDYYHDTKKWFNPKGLPINFSWPIISSRSCPNHCNFCSMYQVMGHKWRNRSYMNVVDEIEFIYNEYGHRHFSFMDDNLTLNKEHVLNLCNEIIKRNLDIQFETPNGVATYTFDKEILDALVKAGLIRVSFAIESGNEYIRNKVIGKNLSHKKIMDVMKWSKKHFKKLYTRAFFIMGFPEETKQSLDDTFQMIKEIDVDKPIVSNLMPFAGTELFDQIKKDKLFIGNIDIKNLWNTPMYFTNNKQFFIKPYNMSIKQLQEYRKKFDKLTDQLILKKKEERM